MAESVVIFDSNGRVLIANKTWIELNRQIGFKTGIRKFFEEHLKILISAKVFPENEGLEVEWISERIEIRRIPSGPIVLGVMTYAGFELMNGTFLMAAQS